MFREGIAGQMTSLYKGKIAEEAREYKNLQLILCKRIESSGEKSQMERHVT